MVDQKSPKTNKSKLVKEAPLHKKPERFFEGVGRRKTAIARVRLYAGSDALKKSDISINERPLADYFAMKKLRQLILTPLLVAQKDFKATAKVNGGGLSSQAEAVRLGLSRALLIFKPELRSKLKVLGFLKRDPRMVERKKAGSRKARRPQQWRKR